MTPRRAPVPTRLTSGLLTSGLGLAGLVASLAGCEPKGTDESLRDLHVSSVALKADSQATREFFETVLGDSIQRERLARTILDNEGMRRTMSQALIADSLSRVPGAGVPGRSAPPPSNPAAPDVGRTPDSVTSRRSDRPAPRTSDFPLREDPTGEHPSGR